jgi:phosphoserine aminotransferase
MEITDRGIDGQCYTVKRNVFTRRHSYSYNTLRTSSLCISTISSNGQRFNTPLVFCIHSSDFS